MNDSSADAQSPPEGKTPKLTPPEMGPGWVARVGLFVALLAVAAGGWAAYVYVTGKNGFSWNRFLFQTRNQTLVAATGKVIFNGKPMGQGVLFAHPVDEASGAKFAMGKLEKDGSFTMMTDVDGIKPGIYPGRYKIVLNVTYPLQPGQLGPTPRLPKEYYDAETTPVEIEVTDDPEKNHFVIDEKGVENPPPGGGRGAKKKGKRPSRKEIIDRIMANDKNGDGKISRDEASDRLKSNFDQVDANKDGFIDRDELNAMLRSRGKKRGKKQ